MKSYQVSIMVAGGHGSPGKNWKDCGIWLCCAINRAQAEWLAQYHVERSFPDGSSSVVQYQVKERAVC